MENEAAAGARGAEPSGGSAAPRWEPPGAGAVVVAAATNAAFEEEPPPYSPPDPKSAHLLCAPFPAQRGSVLCAPGPLPPHSSYEGPPSTTGPSAAGHGQPLPKDYLVESVLVTVFCCLLTGFVALIYSHEGQEEPRPERRGCRVLPEPALSQRPRRNSSTGCGMRLCCGVLDPVTAEHLGGAEQDLVPREHPVGLGLETEPTAKG